MAQQYIRISFIRDSEIKFANSVNGKRAWYGSDYAKGTYIDVLEILSADEKEIKVKCMDGEVGILLSNCVKVNPA